MDYIVFGIFILAASTGGFFLGHWKREDKLPDKIPMPSIKEIINAVRPDKPPKLSREEERELAKANDFFN